MGYYTAYSLEIEDLSQHTFHELDAAVGEMNGDLEGIEWGGKPVWQNSNSPITWYDHEEDMVKLSLKFPELLFTLSGVGDSAEDMWKKYFLGGLIQRAKAEITYAEFDKTKLSPQTETEE